MYQSPTLSMTNLPKDSFSIFLTLTTVTTDMLTDRALYTSRRQTESTTKIIHNKP